MTIALSRAGRRPRRLYRRLANHPWPRALGLVLLFVALTDVMLWPLPLHAGSAVQDLGDPLFEIWVMRWEQHALLHDPAAFWDTNQFYPLHGALVFSEPALSSALLAAPLQLATGNAVLSYNLLLMATFVLAAVGTSFLVRELTGSLGAGIVAGTAAAFAPLRYGHLSHLHILSYGWLPLALWALVRFSRRPSAGSGALAALLLTVQVLASDTVAVMLALATVVVLPFLIWDRGRELGRRRLGGLALVLAVPALAFAPVAWEHLRVSHLYGLERDLTLVEQMSATPHSYLSIYDRSSVWRGLLPTAYPDPLFPGGVALLGAGLALTLGWRGHARWTALGLTLAVVGAIFSFGPYLRLDGRAVPLPYLWLYDHLPGFDAMRDASRFGIVALLGVAVLAGIGFATAFGLLTPRFTSAARFVTPGLTALLVVAILVEAHAPAGAVPVPRDAETTAVYDWLAGQPAGAVFELPSDGLFGPKAWLIRWAIEPMFLSTRDWQPTVGGYSGYVPQRYLDILARFRPNPRGATLSAENVGLLQDLGVRYLVIHRAAGFDWQQAASVADRLPELERIGVPGDSLVYQLSSAGRQPLRLALDAPASARPGELVNLDVSLTNPNTNDALGSLEGVPIQVDWLDQSGAVAARYRLPTNLPAALPPGENRRILPVQAPRRAGTYQLRVSYLELPAATRTMPVEGAALAGGNAPLRAEVESVLNTVTAGATLAIESDWLVQQRQSSNLSVTFQLLGEGDRPVAQVDLPLSRDGLPLSDSPPGTGIHLSAPLKIPPELAPGSYRLLIAAYDPKHPRAARVELQQPDGTTTRAIILPLTVDK